MNIEPIGVVHSPIAEPTDEGWGQVIAEICLQEWLAPALQGLEQFSHAIIVYYLHQSPFDPQQPLVRRPRGLDDMPPLGLFAQRSRHRPNPIGVTAVEIVAVRGNVLAVKGLDAIDGTPVLDIKPYYPAYDRVEAPRTPAWVDELMAGYF